MAVAEPIIVVLGPWCGGTSAVAGVLQHLGVFMGTQFDWNYRELHDTWVASTKVVYESGLIAWPGVS